MIWLSWFSWPCHLSVILYPGFLRDRLGDYNVAFYLAGIPPLIGGAVLCVIPWVEARKKRKEANATAETTEKMLEHKSAAQDGKTEDPESVIWGTCGSDIHSAETVRCVCERACVCSEGLCDFISLQELPSNRASTWMRFLSYTSFREFPIIFLYWTFRV